MSSKAKPAVPTDELRAVLQRVLSRHFAAPQRIKNLRRRRSSYSSSHTIENVEVELENQVRLRMVFKDLSPGSLLTDAQQVRPRFLYDPRREIRTYRKILQPRGLGTAIFYGAIDSRREKRFWLFLERVTGPLLWQVAGLAAWEEAARWLARLHNEFDGARQPEQGGHSRTCCNMTRPSSAFGRSGRRNS